MIEEEYPNLFMNQTLKFNKTQLNKIIFKTLRPNEQVYAHKSRKRLLV